MTMNDPVTLSLVRRILLGGCVLGAGALVIAPQAVAQQAIADTSPKAEELETVVVTGSYIRRADLESTVPLTVIDQAAIETRNALLPSDLLMSLPSVVNLPENESRLGSSGARGDNANINMRNMGATATLILVNGRRMAVNPMTAGLSQAVNVNQLPTQGIERIEVLRDGASSIYGSDAVGGVINYVLKREFDGIEAGLRYFSAMPSCSRSATSATPPTTPIVRRRRSINRAVPTTRDRPGAIGRPSASAPAPRPTTSDP
jgi:outer membrane cobalamin receptor